MPDSAVTLMGAGTQTQGVALVNMLRSLDLQARGAKLVERVSDVVLDDAMARSRAIWTVESSRKP